ncbi:MAG: DUF402 domain-containing protein [Bacilli bacterium]|nr:DUF402 domain-containing protein [Bacilli bacterium]
MQKMCVGDKFQIHCYKHNGRLHRTWDEAILLETNKDYLVFGNDKTLVKTELENNTWNTKEPAIIYFFKKQWFNIIVQLKKTGISYYCNIASPFIIEDNAIKYIDYDLDLRIFSGGSYKILDRMEYQYHKRIMNYSNDLDKVINNGLDRLIKLYLSEALFFDKSKNYEYYQIYKKIMEAENSSNFK